MSIEKKGDFVQIQKVLVRISEILSVRPKSIVLVGEEGIIRRDFPKIVVTTTQGSQEFMYSMNEEGKRDADLRILQEIIGTYQTRSEEPGRNTIINVTGSSGINIVSNSQNVKITQENVNEANRILKEMRSELQKLTDINEELKEDIDAVILEIEKQLNDEDNIKRHTFRSLLGITSEFASLGSLTIALGQLFGFI